MKLEEAEKLQNPLKSASLAAEMSIKYEDLGQQKYEINCAICHGTKGDGYGALVEKRGDLLLKKPPSLLDDSYKKYSDGRMYYVITYGWGLMGNYGTQITDENERWAVVNYIRELQKLGAGSPSAGDK
jgi:mono/diheme cytochrome c family protein